MTDDEAPVSPAHAYQTYFARAVFEPLAERVVGRHTPAAGDAVLDVACGTGILTRRLASAVGPEGQVVGVDVNPQMLEAAREFTDRSAPIAYLQGDGTALDLPDDAFDAVYCQQGLQFFPDRAAGVGEMRRVLRTGGSAVIATWRGLEEQPLYAALAEAEKRNLAAAEVPVDQSDLDAPFSLGDPDELRALLIGAGFDNVTVESATITARFADADHFVRRMEYAYAAVVPQFVDDPDAFAAFVAAVERDTATAIDNFRHADEIVVGVHTNIAVAN